MQKPNADYIKSSFFDLGELDDPHYYKNQSFSLKLIHSICQLPSFNDFNELGQRHHPLYQQHYDNTHQQHKQILEMKSFVHEAEEHSDKQDKSIGSTNVHLCSHLTIAENIQQPIASPTPKKGSGCNCKKTGCLKMYCECFSSGKVCTDQCNCCNCSNSDIQSQHVIKAQEIARNKHKFAFNPLDGSNRKYCNCRKTQCQKKYCQCYNSGQACSELCKCEDCLNGTHSPDEHEQAVKQLIC